MIKEDNKIYNKVFEELDSVVREIYLSILFEDRDSRSSSSLISKAITFGPRAIRFQRAKSIIEKYAKKIIPKIEKMIKKFEENVDKSVPQIQKKGEELKNKLDAAKAANNKIKMKAIVDQQKKYIEEVEDDLKNRFSSLKSSIDNLLDVYTNAIHRRIEEPGYLLNVVISPSGQTELKALWQEKIAEIKQQSYEKLLKKLNNEKIMGLEALTSELQVEIEREEDERRRYRSLGYNKFISDENKGFYEIKKYLNDKLPKGLKNEFVYKYFVGGEEIIEDAIINVDDFDKEIVVYLYKEGEGKIAGEPIRTIEIEDMEDAKDLVDRIDRGMESKKYIDLDREYEKYTNNLYNFLETFITKTKDSKNMIHILGYDFYTKYENKKNLKKLVDYIIDEILNNREKYDREINLLNSQISDKALVNLFLKYFVPKFEKYEREEELKSKKEKESKTKNENESFISLSEYKKLYE